MREKFPFGFIFFAGFIIGMIVMNFGKSILLDGTGLLDEGTLRQLSGMTTDGSALFAFVLRKRIVGFVVLVVAATTYLGLAVCVIMTGWYGFAAGTFLAAGMLRYGFRGVLLVLASVMPQYLLYVPAVYGLLLWCEKTYRMIYQKGIYQGKEIKAPVLSGRVLLVLGIFIVLVAGCALESFVNPSILQGFLKML